MRASTSTCRCFDLGAIRSAFKPSSTRLRPATNLPARSPTLTRQLRSLADLDSKSSSLRKPKARPAPDRPSQPDPLVPRPPPGSPPCTPSQPSHPASPAYPRAPTGPDPFDPVRPLLILGLESSADDSCAAVLYSPGPGQPTEVRSNVVIKQAAIHEQFGGIHPLHAQEAHQRNMPLAIAQALDQAGVTIADLDGVGFTRGPGMYGALSVCAGAAKTIAAVGKPGLRLVGAHHMQAHALTPIFTEATPPEFPFLTLLVSGGHTLLLLARSESSFKILATAKDESIGMSFDKAARDLRIPWSEGAGSPGAALSAWANLPTTPTSQPIPPSSPPTPSSPFTLPLRGQLAFSFSGLRSALMRVLAKEPVDAMPEARSRQLAREFVGACVGQVEEKVRLAVRACEAELGGETLKGVVASGGVASNAFLRMRLRHTLDKMGSTDLPLVFPPPSLCTDNAAMIANVAISRIRRGRLDPITVMQRAKWSTEECEAEFEGEQGEGEAST